MKSTVVEIQSPLGSMAGIFSNRGLTALYFSRLSGDELFIAAHRRYGDVQPQATEPYGLSSQLADYFAGTRTQFEIPLDVSGTLFQLEVWRALLQVPFGKTISYSQLATVIGKPKAARAVGNAVGANPLAVIVPCHRVIANNGKLGGYTGGLDIKRFLLRHEGVTIPG